MHVNNATGWIWFGSLFIFLIISWMIWIEFPLLIDLERKVYTAFQKEFGHPRLSYSDGIVTGWLTFLVTYGSAPYLSALTVVIALILGLQGYVLIAIWLLGVVSTGGIFGTFLKKMFKRARPKKCLDSESGYSFPSGHAIASTLFFGSFVLVFLPNIESEIIRIALIFLLTFTWFGILFSRLYFHAHHLSDVIVGFFYGLFWVQSAMFIYNWFLIGWFG